MQPLTSKLRNSHACFHGSAKRAALTHVLGPQLLADHEVPAGTHEQHFGHFCCSPRPERRAGPLLGLVSSSGPRSSPQGLWGQREAGGGAACCLFRKVRRCPRASFTRERRPRGGATALRGAGGGTCAAPRPRGLGRGGGKGRRHLLLIPRSLD